MKRAVVLRYASIGDAIQASSPIAELYDSGYAVDVVTSEDGENVLRHDPHISKITSITPTVNEGDYRDWVEKHTKGYDLVANLTACVEGELATEPVNRNYYLPTKVRRDIYGRVNYVARQHVLAQVPYRRNRQWFYETPEEKEQALDSFGERVTVGVSLCGSHPYKAWPKLPDFCAQLLKTSPVRLFLLGAFEARDMAIQESILDDIKKQIGPLESPDLEIVSMVSSPVRMSMTVACLVDVLIGPDTGLLNAAAMRPNKKIVFLTHNTIENVTRDWRNTTSIQSTFKCSPCLRLRHRDNDCPQTDGAPSCTHHISVDRILGETEIAIAALSVPSRPAVA